LKEDSEISQCTFKPAVHHPAALENLSKYGEPFEVRLFKNISVRDQVELANKKARDLEDIEATGHAAALHVEDVNTPRVDETEKYKEETTATVVVTSLVPNPNL
jgi:hypothetical protein